MSRVDHIQGECLQDKFLQSPRAVAMRVGPLRIFQESVLIALSVEEGVVGKSYLVNPAFCGLEMF